MTDAINALAEKLRMAAVQRNMVPTPPPITPEGQAPSTALQKALRCQTDFQPDPYTVTSENLVVPQGGGHIKSYPIFKDKEGDEFVSIDGHSYIPVGNTKFNNVKRETVSRTRTNT